MRARATVVDCWHTCDMEGKEERKKGGGAEEK
jgi:hypothetical protein